jgi:hypothetical protein
MTSGGKNRLWLWLLAVTLLLAFGLRLYRLGAESLWYDETVSVHLAGKSLPALVAHTAGDIHPPGYYVLLHSWIRLAGSSDFALAFPSLFFGVLLVALAYWLGAQVFGPRAGLLAAFLVAISPFNIWYSQEVRMYTLGAVLGIGALGAVAPLLVGPRSRASAARGRLAVYAVCSALGLWILYYFAFLLVAVNLMVGLWWLITAGRHAGWRRREGWRWLGLWALAQAAVLLLYAPWIPTAWRQATQPPVPPWRSFTGLGDLWVQTWSALCLGQSAEAARVWPALLLFAILFGLGLLSKRLRPPLKGGWQGSDTLPWFLAGYVFVPVFLIYLASFVTPLYHVRYAFTYSTPFYIIIAAGLAWLWRRWRVLAWLGLAVIVAFSGMSLHAYHTDPHYASDDHRAAAKFLADRWRPGDAILVNAGYAYTALLTYWDGDPIAWQGRLVGDAAGDWDDAVGSGPVVVQTGTVDGDPSLGWGDPDSDFYRMDRVQTFEALERLFAGSDRVWVYRIYDTVTDPDGYIRVWLQEHGTPFEDRVFTGESQLRVQGYLTGRDPMVGVERPFEAALADGSLWLMGVTPLPPPVEVGKAIDLALVWRVDSPAAGETILFAGLFDEAGHRWAQADERVLGPLYPAAAWPAGALVRTPLRLAVPPGTPPGRYWLEVGWYRFQDGQPVWLPWTSGDRWVLGEVEVVAPEDWSALPLPSMAQTANVLMGPGVRLLGFEAPSLERYPGEALELDLYWQALQDEPQAGLAVLQLQDDSGQVLAEASSAPVGGQAPFARLQSGQSVRDPRSFTLAAGVAPGVYNLLLGRQRADGNWMPVRRPPFPLGPTYPLVTVRVLGRPMQTTPPQVENAVDALFGGGIHLIGYDLQYNESDLGLTLHWQALSTMSTRYKLFAHLVSDGTGSEILTQTDVYPHLPTTAWIPGEVLSDHLVLELPADLPPGAYTLWLGLYDEASGLRLPVFDAAGEAIGDSLVLAQIDHGE